jgi:hypothetical protein
MPAVQTLIATVSKLAPVGGRVRSLGATLRRSLVPAESAYMRAGVEPPLKEMLRDPIVRARMRRAGVDAGEVRRLLDEARRRRPPD